MKKTHILGLALIGIAITVLTLQGSEMSSYATFADALAAEEGRQLKVVGTLAKDRPVEYDPVENPNYFTFYMNDEDGEQRRVILQTAKPQDFERSEQIVLTGRMKGDDFLASDMLMKCPSKYKDEEIRIRTKAPSATAAM